MKREGISYKFKNEVEYFDSFSEAMQVCKENRRPRGSMFGEWAGGVKDWADAERLDREGWKEGTSKLEKGFDAASVASIATQGESMQMDYAGFMPCIPTYLAGEPMHMRRKVPCETSKAPITIVVGAGSSGGVDVKDMEARAAAIGCLVMYLSVYRAVTVYITCFLESTNGYGNSGKNDYYLPMVKVGTTPIDLPQLAWQLVHPFNARGILYSLGNYGESGIGWATINGKSAYHMEPQQLRDAFQEILDLQPDDILIPDLKYKDPDQSNPELWARTRMKAMGYDM